MSEKRDLLVTQTVCRLVDSGKTHREVGDILGIPRSHIGEIYQGGMTRVVTTCRCGEKMRYVVRVNKPRYYHQCITCASAQELRNRRAALVLH